MHGHCRQNHRLLRGKSAVHLFRNHFRKEATVYRFYQYLVIRQAVYLILAGRLYRTDECLISPWTTDGHPNAYPWLTTVYTPRVQH